MKDSFEKNKIELERYLWPDQLAEIRRRRSQRLILVALIVVSFLFGFLVNGAFTQTINKQVGKPTITTPTTPQQSINTYSDKFNQIYDILTREWYFSRDLSNPDEMIMDNAIKGMIEKNNDEYTEYFTREELEEFTHSINLDFSGIGVQYYNANGFYVVSKVFKDSPADKAGVLPGDIFYTVDGEYASAISQDEISNRVRGKQGSVVVIEFKRDQDIVKKEIVRDKIYSTAYGEIKGDIGYLEINSFGETTGREVKKYLDYFESNQIQKLLIDLRNNGGGYLSALEDIANFFLEKGMTIIQQERVDGIISKTRANGKKYDSFNEIKILINENSASASEVLTAALKENIDATTIGVKSFGKGTVQTTTEFLDGTALKVTVAQWLSPLGNRINKVGISPDIEVKQHQVFYTEYPVLKEGETINPDTVSSQLVFIQQALDFLGYSVDRFDGYYSVATRNALEQFISENNLSATTQIDAALTSQIISNVNSAFHSNPDQYDWQLNAALEQFQ